MDRETALKELKQCQESGDTEIAHSEADNVLCQLLTSLGYDDVVEEYIKVDKWFA